MGTGILSAFGACRLMAYCACGLIAHAGLLHKQARCTSRHITHAGVLRASPRRTFRLVARFGLLRASAYCTLRTAPYCRRCALSQSLAATAIYALPARSPLPLFRISAAAPRSPLPIAALVAAALIAVGPQRLIAVPLENRSEEHPGPAIRNRCAIRTARRAIPGSLLRFHGPYCASTVPVACIIAPSKLYRT